MQSSFADGILWYGVFVGSTVCHEAAHAWSALRLGDDTAARGGQVSLNPIPHIKREPIGMVVMPLVTWFLGGWIMGWASAPYDREWARTYPKRAGLMALAGPAANLSLVLLAALLIRVGIEWHLFEPPFRLGMDHVASAVNPGALDYVTKVLSVVFSLNLLLCVFNLLPIPPLDGSCLPLLVLPAPAAAKYQEVLASPALRLIGLFIISRGLGSLFPPILRFVVGLLYPGEHYG